MKYYKSRIYSYLCVDTGTEFMYFMDTGETRIASGRIYPTQYTS